LAPVTVKVTVSPAAAALPSAFLTVAVAVSTWPTVPGFGLAATLMVCDGGGGAWLQVTVVLAEQLPPALVQSLAPAADERLAVTLESPAVPLVSVTCA